MVEFVIYIIIGIGCYFLGYFDGKSNGKLEAFNDADRLYDEVLEERKKFEEGLNKQGGE